MSRTEKIILWGTVGLILLMVLLDALTPREPSWDQTFSRYKKEPYGCSLVYDRLGDLFPKGVKTVRQTPYSTDLTDPLHDGHGPVNRIFINGSFNPSGHDFETLMDWAHAGDDVFLAASSFRGAMADSLDLDLGMEMTIIAKDNALQGASALLFGRPDSLRFTVDPLRDGPASVFIRGDLSLYFNTPLPGTVVAVNQHGHPVLLQVPVGKGRLWLCTVPLAFTNYYLLKDESRSFMAGVFNLLPDRPVLWDEYYSSGPEGSQTPLRYILSQPALKVAYWTLIALLLLTVLVHARRRQRAIPVVAAPRNTSRDFAETMARLYYFRGDHADLAHKLIAQFKEEVRLRLRMPDSTWDADGMAEIARRSGIPPGELTYAGRLMEHHERTTQASEDQLIQLNKTLSRLRAKL